MKKNNPNEPFPLTMVKNITKKYPFVWDEIEFIRNGKGKDLPDWDDVVYVPIAATIAVCNKYKVKTSFAQLQALAAWRQYKEIYSFSPELIELLFEQADETIEIPIEILLHIPYPCIYIDFGEYVLFDEFKGVFVCFEQDMTPDRFGKLEMRLCFVISPDESTIDLSLHLGKNRTISDGINSAIRLSMKNMTTAGIDTKSIRDLIEENGVWQKELFSKIIQLILYICAENADIDENAKQKEITRKPKASDKPKDAFREIRKWDVGVKISKAIKHHNQVSRNDNAENSDSTHSTTFSSSGSTKRPHVRRGHWHHYWIGSDKTDNRRLILKWTAPMFIGNADDTIATINELE